MTNFEYIINRMASQHGVHSLFSDLLDLLIYTFSGGRKENEYLELIRKYEKPEAYTVSEAMAALLVEMTGDGNGMVDVLGKYYEENLSDEKNGQYFTPQLICDRMARIQNSAKSMERISDATCGNGRMLMAFAKVNRFAKFYGIDNNANCAKMAVINLCLNKMYGEIAWLNSLSNQYFGGWKIEPTIKGIPRIVEITRKQSYIQLKLPEVQNEMIEVPQ